MRTFDDMPGWQFEIDEVSMGVYEVIVSDENGDCRYSAKGTDPNALLQKGHQEALKLKNTA
jgi:hypothetical protein